MGLDGNTEYEDFFKTACYVLYVGSFTAIIGGCFGWELVSWIGFAIFLSTPFLASLAKSFYETTSESSFYTSRAFKTAGIAYIVLAVLVYLVGLLIDEKTTTPFILILVAGVLYLIASSYFIKIGKQEMAAEKAAEEEKHKEWEKQWEKERKEEERARKNAKPIRYYCSKCGKKKGVFLGYREEFAGNTFKKVRGYAAERYPNGVQSGRVFRSWKVYQCEECGFEWSGGEEEIVYWD